MDSIAVWGDSIARGVVYDEQRGRHTLLKEGGFALAAKEAGLLLNSYARFGSTVQKGLETVKRSLERGEKSKTAILEFGGNDSDFDWAQVAKSPEKEHLPFTPAPLFESVYRNMIELVREKGIRPMLMNLPPVDAGRYLSFITRAGLSAQSILRWLGDVEVIHRFQEGYSAMIGKIAREEGCPLIDVRSAFEALEWKKLLCADGIHPNAEGQRVIGLVLTDALKRG